MLRTVPSSTYRHLVRALKMATIVVVSACQPECDDPTGPDVQASVGGRVTLNGEPLAGITVSGGAGSTVTSPTGSYSLTVQGEEFPLITCVSIQSAPYAAIQQATASVTGCPLTLDNDGGTTVNWAYTHVSPSIRISSPSDGAQVGNRSVALRWVLTSSAGLNGSDVLIPPPARWSSNIDGSLGEGSYAPLSTDLSVGAHELTVVVTDLFGITVTDQVSVEVVDPSNQSPSASITSPESGLAYDNGVTLDFAGTGSDPEEGALTGSALTWTSSQEGEVGTGESFSRVMAQGSHVIVLRATDTQGASGTDTIFIHINAPPGGQGTIQGTVSIGGSPLVEIPVVLSGAAAANTVTNGAGAYSFTDLAPGVYTITITPPAGADIGTEQTVTLADGQALTVNFTG